MKFRGLGGESLDTSTITFCLNQLEKARDFNHGMTIHTEIVDDLCIEEIIGALVAAEATLKDMEEAQ